MDHIAFASDCPFAPIAETVQATGRLALEPDPRERICGGNAGALLNAGRR